MENLEGVVQQTIVESLNLSIDPSSLAVDAPLFAADSAGGLGLDSLNSLEILAALSDRFQAPLDDIEASDFYSIATLAEYLKRSTAKQAQPVGSAE